MRRDTLRLMLGVVALIVACGTVFFHFVEGWSWLDSYFFTVVTLSTVGYGSLVPTTVLGKLATTVLIFLGLAVVAVIIQQFGMTTMRSRLEVRRTLREAQSKAAEAEKERDATREKGPDA